MAIISRAYDGSAVLFINTYANRFLVLRGTLIASPPAGTDYVQPFTLIHNEGPRKVREF